MALPVCSLCFCSMLLTWTLRLLPQVPCLPLAAMFPCHNGLWSLYNKSWNICGPLSCFGQQKKKKNEFIPPARILGDSVYLDRVSKHLHQNPDCPMLTKEAPSAFWKWSLLWSSGWHGTCYVDQTCLKHREIHLSLPTKCLHPHTHPYFHVWLAPACKIILAMLGNQKQDHQ